MKENEVEADDVFGDFPKPAATEEYLGDIPKPMTVSNLYT